MYTQPLSGIISQHPVSHISFADDTQLRRSDTPEKIGEVICNIQSCVSDVRIWMTENKLKLNEDKTEAMIISSKYMPKSILASLPSSMLVESATISFSKTARNLGVLFDTSLCMEKHVSQVCRTAYYELRRIASIRHLLTVETTKKLVCAFVLSRLDYCNSILIGCPKSLIDRLQKVQNNAARLVLKARKRDHVTPLLFSLHWLPVSYRIQYKILSLCYSSLFGDAHIYLTQLLHLYVPGRLLRSSADTRILDPPVMKAKTLGERSFSFQAPLLWNNLPREIRYCTSLSSFKTSLKTHLFRQAFS